MPVDPTSAPKLRQKNQLQHRPGIAAHDWSQIRLQLKALPRAFQAASLMSDNFVSRSFQA